MRNQLRLPTRLVARNGELPPPPPPPPPPPQEMTPSWGWMEESTCHYLFLELPDFKEEEIKMKIEGLDRVKIWGERNASGEKKIFFDKTYTVPDNADVERINSKLEGGTFTVKIPKHLPPVEAITSEKTLPDIGDLKKENGHGEDEKLEDQEQPQPDYIGDSKKLESDYGEDDDKFKDQKQPRPDIGDSKKESDHDEDEKLKEHQKDNEKSAEEEEQKDFSNSAVKMICDSKNTIFMTVIAFCLGVLVSLKIRR